MNVNLLSIVRILQDKVLAHLTQIQFGESAAQIQDIEDVAVEDGSREDGKADFVSPDVAAFLEGQSVHIAVVGADKEVVVKGRVVSVGNQIAFDRHFVALGVGGCVDEGGHGGRVPALAEIFHSVARDAVVGSADQEHVAFN